ncbi:hypothetical protein O181_060063 [Austropuccinia psidii MF-1]|uniref:Uncharacterized protein n=1 Tax=Austropuccinia psidii MF-1 TaxID=1389203 RepID=A0A9Q3EK08_9BASI|nr:hypothetical protein [Austropuccinia psidii MF-1]
MWKPISTQRNIRAQNSASIQGQPNLPTCTGNITIINPVVTSKGKLPKAVDRKFGQGPLKGKYPKNIELLTACKHLYVTFTPQKPWLKKETSQRIEKACPEPEDLEENIVDTVVDGKKLREIIPPLPFTFQSNRK